MSLKSLVFLCVTSLAIGCSDSSGDKTGGESPGTETTGGADTRAFDEAVAQFRSYSGIGERTRTVIKSQDEWAAAWAAISARHEPKPPVPYVDFSKHMVLLATMGGRPTSGFSIELKNASTTRGDVSAEVLETSLGDRCFAATVITTPLAAALVPRSEGEVTFVESTATNDCAD